MQRGEQFTQHREIRDPGPKGSGSRNDFCFLLLCDTNVPLSPYGIAGGLRTVQLSKAASNRERMSDTNVPDILRPQKTGFYLRYLKLRGGNSRGRQRSAADGFIMEKVNKKKPPG